MDATMTGRPADTTVYSLKPSNRTVGTSVLSLVPIIDHDMEEKDHHHVLTAVRGQSIVVDETSGRTGLFASSWNNRTVSLHQQYAGDEATRHNSSRPIWASFSLPE
jgi:hypothetical protein